MENLGFFGILGRANANVDLRDKGGKGDDIVNMVIAEKIVASNPLPEPVAPPQPSACAVRSRGRPAKRRRRCLVHEL